MEKNNFNIKRKQRIFPSDDDAATSKEKGYVANQRGAGDSHIDVTDETVKYKEKNDNRNKHKNILNKFKNAIRNNSGKSKAIELIVNLKSGASKWKEYTTHRRQLHGTEVRVDNVDGTECEVKTRCSGIGLDQIHDNFLIQNSKHVMSVESNRALINYFADLGRQTDENAAINLEFVDSLLSSGAQIDCTDKHGQCVLHEVARAWHTDVAKYLIEHGADVNQADDYGRTPLHVAAAVDYPEMVKVLIEHGANREARTRGEEQTAVHYAAKNDACLSLKALIDDACEYKLVRDFKLRTPIHLAAELDRSETAHMLLELGAPVGVADDCNQKAITWMIAKMPPVAKDALNEFHSADRAKRKQYFRLDLLVQRNYEDSHAQSPLHVAVSNRQFDLLTHRVFLKLIQILWHRFGRLAAWKSLLANFCFIMLWTLKATIIQYDQKYLYKLPSHWWRIALFAGVVIFTAYYICEEVLEYIRSVHAHRKWRSWREKEIDRDMKYCHPCWPEERLFLQQELNILDDTKPKYFKDLWNVFDWICYVMVLASIISHVVDIIDHSDSAARTHIRIMCITVILLWMRLLKNARAFELIGPFIVIAGHMLYDIIRFVFLYMEFYVPFVCAFWMIFGGTQNVEYPSTTTGTELSIKGFRTMGEVFFSLFRLTLVDEYEYDNMKLVDTVMSDILLGFWFALSAILCLNLFIALLSDTFQRVYDNAQANAVMQKTITILSWWDSMSYKKKAKFFQYIDLHCAPVTEYYDDDVSMGDDYDLQKVTIQIKRDLKAFVEKYDSHRETIDVVGGGEQSSVTLGRFETETRALRESMKTLQTRQEDMMDRMKREMRTVRALLEEIAGHGVKITRDISPAAVLRRSDPGNPVTTETDRQHKGDDTQLHPHSASHNTDESHKSRKHRRRKDTSDPVWKRNHVPTGGFLELEPGVDSNLPQSVATTHDATPTATSEHPPDTTRPRSNDTDSVISQYTSPALQLTTLSDVRGTPTLEQPPPTFPEIRLLTNFENIAFEKDDTNA